jgi:hypothetical protein
MTKKNAATVAEEELPLIARIINHVLTPGSSLTTTVWASFNIIMALLFCIWLLFLFSFPSDVNVWIFGVLGGGLFGSTNWFMYEIFNAKEDFASQQQKQQKESAKPIADENKEDKKIEQNSKTGVSAGTNNQSPKKVKAADEGKRALDNNKSPARPAASSPKGPAAKATDPKQGKKKQ